MSTAEGPPSWLVAWRDSQPWPRTPAKPKPRPTPKQRPRTGRLNEYGFVVPSRWPWDGGVRREPVLDTDQSPPSVVRRVGWRRCLRCARPFFSDDVVGQRLCDVKDGCRGCEDGLA